MYKLYTPSCHCNDNCASLKSLHFPCVRTIFSFLSLKDNICQGSEATNDRIWLQQAKSCCSYLRIILFACTCISVCKQICMQTNSIYIQTHIAHTKIDADVRRARVKEKSYIHTQLHFIRICRTEGNVSTTDSVFNWEPLKMLQMFQEFCNLLE